MYFRFRIFTVIFLLFAGFLPPGVAAQDVVWNAGASGSWFYGPNWSTGSEPNGVTIPVRITYGTVNFDIPVTTPLASVTMANTTANASVLNFSDGLLKIDDFVFANVNAASTVNIYNGGTLNIARSLILGNAAQGNSANLNVYSGGTLYLPGAVVNDFGDITIESGANIHFDNAGSNLLSFTVAHGALNLGKANYYLSGSAVTPDLNLLAGEAGDTTGTATKVAITGGWFDQANLTAQGGTTLTIANVYTNSSAPGGIKFIENSTVEIRNSRILATGSNYADGNTSVSVYNSNVNFDIFNLTASSFYMERGVYAGDSGGQILLKLGATATFQDVKNGTAGQYLSIHAAYDNPTVTLLGNTTAVLLNIDLMEATLYQNSKSTKSDILIVTDASVLEIRGGDFFIGGNFQVFDSTFIVGGVTTWVSGGNYADNRSDVNLFLHGHGFNAIEITGLTTLAANSYTVSDTGIGMMLLSDETVELMNATLDAASVTNAHSGTTIDTTLFHFTNVSDSTGMKIQVVEAGMDEWVMEGNPIYFVDPADGEAGNVKITGEDWIVIKFDGVLDNAVSDALLAYLDANIRGSGLFLYKEAGSIDRFILSGDLYGDGGYAYFGWNLAEFNYDNSTHVTIFSLSVPEPTTWLLLLTGVAVLGYLRRKKA